MFWTLLFRNLNLRDLILYFRIKINYFINPFSGRLLWNKKTASSQTEENQSIGDYPTELISKRLYDLNKINTRNIKHTTKNINTHLEWNNTYYGCY